MHRFYIAQPAIKDGKIIIDGETAHQLTKVLRVTPGEFVEVFDGGGTVARVEVEFVAKDHVLGKLIETSESKTEPRLHVALVQGLPKGDKLEFIIQKATELGVKEIYPVSSMRSVVQLDDKKANARLVRWQKVAIEAAEQSGRAVIPRIHTLSTLIGTASELSSAGYKLAAPWEQEKACGLVAYAKKTIVDNESAAYPRLAIFIGPEGGFDQSEMDRLSALGAHPVTLGPRIMRTETAAIAALCSAFTVSEDIP